jgi:hypothetical protein
VQHRGAVCGWAAGPASSSHPIFGTDVIQKDVDHPFLIDLHPGPPSNVPITLGFYVRISHWHFYVRSTGPIILKYETCN